MKTIFITSFHPFISRNILNTDVLRILKSEDLKIIILAPKEKKGFIEEYFASENVKIEGVDLEPIRNSRSVKFFHNQAFLLLNYHYNRYIRRERLKPDSSWPGYFKFRFLNLVSRTLSGHRTVNAVFRKLDNYLTPDDFFSEYFDRYKPDMVFSTDIYTDFDQAIIKESKARKIFVMGMIRSWDNNYSKGLCRYIPDKLITNNETIKSEAVQIHNFSPDNIYVAGIPQFDDYTRPPAMSREEFFRSIGADPNKKLITLSPAGYPLVPLDEDNNICNILKEAQDKKLIPDSIQFFVRSHPHRPTQLTGVPSSGFIVEKYEGSFKMPGKIGEFSPKDKIHLVNTLAYSDMIIWSATSLGIDALIFDKPQIVINFDATGNKPYWNSVRRYHDEDHMRKFLDTGAAKIVNSRQELFSAINVYLKNPSQDSEKRNIARDQQLWRTDGGAGGRIANYLLKFIHEQN